MDEAALRAEMIESLQHQLGEPLAEPVVDAFHAVPREAFVSSSPYANSASEENGTEALAPATVARLLDALDPATGQETLVVGVGVGYTAAALAEVVGGRHVHAIDIDREMVYAARSNLADTGYDAVLVDCQDGADGLPQYAPYDRILLEAAVAEPPRALLSQLADDGRLVLPRGAGVQTIVAVEPDGGVEGRRAGDDYRVVEEAGPAQLRAMLVEGEQSGVERNRTCREDAEMAQQGHFAKQGWEQEWVDWNDRF
jgi:protein-L-isoaspartate(D-aspartate) O-methyltransferase